MDPVPARSVITGWCSGRVDGAARARPWITQTSRSAMSTYHLHARLFVGALAGPDARYEFRSSETDDSAEVTAAAKELAGRGFTVVRHGCRSRVPSRHQGAHQTIPLLSTRNRPDLEPRMTAVSRR